MSARVAESVMLIHGEKMIRRENNGVLYRCSSSCLPYAPKKVSTMIIYTTMSKKKALNNNKEKKATGKKTQDEKQNKRRKNASGKD